MNDMTKILLSAQETLDFIHQHSVRTLMTQPATTERLYAEAMIVLDAVSAVGATLYYATYPSFEARKAAQMPLVLVKGKLITVIRQLAAILGTTPLMH